MVPALAERGRVAAIKSIHHDIDVDEEGKDTYRLKQAGAERVVGITPTKRFSVADVRDKQDELNSTLDSLADSGFDYVVVEGFSGASLPKILVSEGGDTEREAREEDVLVSGAADVPTEELVEVVEGVDERETLGSLVRRVKNSSNSPKAGAISTFTGRVRTDNQDETRTTHLEYEEYGEVARDRLREIRADLEAHDGVYEVELHHETGVVPAEEDVVHVVVLAGHRQEAFQAVEDGINRLKDEVPIFKKEITEDDEYWVHNRP